MNDDRRVRLRRVLMDLEQILKEENEALGCRPENLQASPQYEFHEKRLTALEECVEQLKRAIFDYDFRLKEEDKELKEMIKAIEELRKKRPEDPLSK